MYFKPGKKVKEWERAKQELKPAFYDVGITYCEAGMYLIQQPDFTELMQKHRHNFFLTWAHGDKRRNLTGYELITLVILCCVDCHNFLESMPSQDMRALVEEIIARRNVQPITYIHYSKLTE